MHCTISSPSALIDALKTLIAIGFAFAESTRVLHTSKEHIELLLGAIRVRGWPYPVRKCGSWGSNRARFAKWTLARGGFGFCAYLARPAGPELPGNPA